MSYDPATAPIDPQPPRPRKRHIVRNTFLVLTGLVVLSVVLIVAAGGGSTGKPVAAAPSATTQPAAPAATTAPSPTPPPVQAHAVKVWFVVTGTGEPDITYGNDSDNRDGGGTLGVLGSGNGLPFKAWLPYQPGHLYYTLNAQLQGSGDITCEIVITGPGIKTNAVVATGHASGGYNICDAQADDTGDDTGTNWQSEG